MRRVVVIGAGISGLAAARAAWERGRERGEPIEVCVFEREPEVGGKAVTLVDDGWMVETGPTGYLDNEPEVDRLVGWAGLTKQPANTASARRFLVRGGKMREIKASPLGFLSSGILGPTGLLRLAAEPLIPGRPPERGDESVWEFARRRIGRQAADRMIAPMVLGVFAGDAKRLSLPAAFPKMAEIEREHGSLVRGLIARARQKRLKGGPAGPSGTLTSFADGLQELPRALARHPETKVRTGAPVRELREGPEGRFLVNVDDESVPADAVVLAVEPWAAAELLDPLRPEAARRLAEIETPPVSVVALGFGPESFDRVPRGFGVLIPRGEGYRTLGVLWDTHLFPGRSPEGRLLVRAMLGGAVDPSAAEAPPAQQISLCRRELAALFGLTADPVFEHVAVWPRAISQYTLGHLDRVAEVEGRLAEPLALHIAGNGLHGIAFAKAAVRGLETGRAAADQALEEENGR
jgi:oxygen-dependent protoporphyrinogen oxidase